MAITGGIFDRKEEVLDRLRQGPGEAAQEEMTVGIGTDGPVPSRWSLRTIRVTFPWMSGYTLSGVWRILDRLGFKVRSARVQMYSPDPHYAEKEAYLHQCLKEAAQNPRRIVFLFLDEMGYYRWPEPGLDWGQDTSWPAPCAEKAGPNNQQWRIVGVLNALTGQVDYLDDYIVGRQKLIEMYHDIDEIYAYHERIYVAQDNWSIHRHPDVLQALEAFPHIEPVWLPTYAPWLNPIEKLWRWLRQEVLKMHRLAGDFDALRRRVRAFLDQFWAGSKDLLRYVGLLEEGKLAQTIYHRT